MRSLATLAFLLLAAPAFAQRTEVAVLGGYTTAGHIDMKALGIQDLEIDGSFTWGVTAGRFLSDHVGIEASWSRQKSALSLATRDGGAELFDVDVGVLHGNFVYRFGGTDTRLSPYVLAGIGATFFSAQDLESETKLSFGLGAGVKWFPSRRFGVRAQARYVPTLLSDSSSAVCDPFGFCQGTLHQFELMGGLVLRF